MISSTLMKLLFLLVLPGFRSTIAAKAVEKDFTTRSLSGGGLVGMSSRDAVFRTFTSVDLKPPRALLPAPLPPLFACLYHVQKLITPSFSGTTTPFSRGIFLHCRAICGSCRRRIGYVSHVCEYAAMMSVMASQDAVEEAVRRVKKPWSGKRPVAVTTRRRFQLLTIIEDEVRGSFLRA
jgi:hypothetical protein